MEEKLVFKSIKDVPILSMSLQSTLWNKTGTWRYMRPSYRSLRAPCSKACPLEQDISFYLTSLSDGKPEDAWMKMLESNPFPSVCGRVCHHPCESECNRKDYDQGLAINSLERFLGDWGMKKGAVNRHKIEKQQKRVAVIGSGPAGLSCSYFLALKGYPVTIYEAMSEPGGMLRYGIPAYRLPRRILDREIERVESLGVKIEAGKRLGGAVGPDELKPYGAVFLATGNWAEEKPKIKGDQLHGVWHGLSFLREVNSGKKIAPGKKVIVVGGGNTAIDSARSAWRLGGRVTVLYRRSREDMPAIPGEVEEAVKEGVEFIFNAAPDEILGKKASVRGVSCLKTKPGKRDATGRRSPVLVPGTEFSLQADSVILAVGERADLAYLPEGVEREKGLIATDPWGRTTLPGFFAGGDAATGEGYVSRAIASGKIVAGSIDRYLRGEEGNPGEDSREAVGFDKINLDYFSPLEKIKSSSLEVKKRGANFLEVQRGFSEDQARKESGRCFSCGSCIRCNVCLMVCPDVAISFKEPGKEYAIDYDHCKGCGICAVECPRSAMILEEEKWSE
jgi:NADPH-dependent glutamate synthase beta subunit-like oxidoreductase/Pyruvate/2-oxoacid:ferredoxin oxidoreductase delta subunit